MPGISVPKDSEERKASRRKGQKNSLSSIRVFHQKFFLKKIQKRKEKHSIKSQTPFLNLRQKFQSKSFPLYIRMPLPHLQHQHIRSEARGSSRFPTTPSTYTRTKKQKKRKKCAFALSQRSRTVTGHCWQRKKNTPNLSTVIYRTIGFGLKMGGKKPSR